MRIEQIDEPRRFLDVGKTVFAHSWLVPKKIYDRYNGDLTELPLVFAEAISDGALIPAGMIQVKSFNVGDVLYTYGKDATMIHVHEDITTEWGDIPGKWK